MKIICGWRKGVTDSGGYLIRQNNVEKYHIFNMTMLWFYHDQPNLEGNHIQISAARQFCHHCLPVLYCPYQPCSKCGVRYPRDIYGSEIEFRQPCELQIASLQWTIPNIRSLFSSVFAIIFVFNCSVCLERLPQ
jgi:hypothetical protein